MARLFRSRRRFLELVSAIVLLATDPVTAQQNPIVTATQAPPIVTRSSLFGPSVYGSPYGSPQPYATYPYQSFNPSTQAIGNPQQQQQQNTVPGQPQQPGQSQVPATQQALQGGGGGGGGGGGSTGQGNGQGSAAAAPGGDTDGASYEVLQNPGSPLYKRYERNDPAQSQLRPQILTQIGRGKGIRRGFIEESARIAASIQTSAAARLDARYDFSKEMIGDHLVPPVIGEIHGVQERGGDRLLYLTVGAYQIVRPARLVLSPPNWRDYLVVDTADPQTSISALAPTSADERSVYDQAFALGLEKGVEEARQTFEDNLNRLERDYAGMERYHELARQGAVSLPVLKDTKRSVRLADHGQRAFIGEQVVTLRITPQFKAARPAAFK